MPRKSDVAISMKYRPVARGKRRQKMARQKTGRVIDAMVLRSLHKGSPPRDDFSGDVDYRGKPGRRSTDRNDRHADLNDMSAEEIVSEIRRPYESSPMDDIKPVLGEGMVDPERSYNADISDAVRRFMGLAAMKNALPPNSRRRRKTEAHLRFAR